jgi:hypothetical protein
MSNLNIVNEFKKNKIRILTNIYNNNIYSLVINCNNEIKNITRRIIPLKQKNIEINNINKKYNLFKILLKTTFDKDVKTFLNYLSTINTTQIINKKALLIGINYKETSSELSGCINDAISIETFLKHKNFNDIKILTDESEIKPTKDNIMNELKNILQNSNKNDLIFIFYSGHGAYTLDRNGEELDGYDELLVPLDFNYIIDDELKVLIDTYGKPDTTIIALFDCCNSGTSLDLKYQLLAKINYDDISENETSGETPCNVIYISGCRDEQVSLETFLNGKVQGLMTWSFLDIMNTNKTITWRQLVKKMRELLKNSSYQIPQLSSGRLFNPDSKCIL